MTDEEAIALAGAALEAWGGASRPPRLVKNRENVVFEVHLSSGAHAALRLHRPGYQSRAGIESELAWTEGLAAQGLRVAVPVRTLDGALTGEVAGVATSCTGWLAGAPLGAGERVLDGTPAEQQAQMRALGAVLAALHDATDRMALPPGFERPAWDEAGLLGDGLEGAAPLWDRFWLNPALTPAERDELLAARGDALAALARLRDAGGEIGLVHADVLRENVLITPEGLALIDFDDAGFGFRFHDLATAVIQSLDEPGFALQVAALLEGYRACRALPEPAEDWLALFLMLRAMASVGWLISRADAQDPRHRIYVDRALRLARCLRAGTRPWAASAPATAQGSSAA